MAPSTLQRHEWCCRCECDGCQSLRVSPEIHWRPVQNVLCLYDSRLHPTPPPPPTTLKWISRRKQVLAVCALQTAIKVGTISLKQGMLLQKGKHASHRFSPISVKSQNSASSRVCPHKSRDTSCWPLSFLSCSHCQWEMNMPSETDQTLLRDEISAGFSDNRRLWPQDGSSVKAGCTHWHARGFMTALS